MSSEANTPCREIFEAALTQVLNDRHFSKDERSEIIKDLYFENEHGMTSLFEEISRLDHHHAEESKARRVYDLTDTYLKPWLPKVFELLEPVGQCSTPIGVGLGLTKVVVLFAIHASSKYHDLTETTKKIEEQLDLVAVYARQSRKPNELRTGLINVYNDLLDFYLNARDEYTVWKERTNGLHFLQRWRKRLVHWRRKRSSPAKDVKDIHSKLCSHLKILRGTAEALGYVTGEKTLEIVQTAKTEQDKDRSRQLMASLRPIIVEDFWQSQAWTEGTCTWVFSDHCPQMRLWRSSVQQSILVVFGDMASGKTTLTSYMVDNLEKAFPTSSAIVCSYSWDNSDERVHQPTSLVRTLLFQLYSQRKELVPLAAGRSERVGSIENTSQMEQWAMFSEAARCIPEDTIFVVLDGLEKCERPVRERLISRLREIVENKNVKLVNTCVNTSKEALMPLGAVTDVDMRNAVKGDLEIIVTDRLRHFLKPHKNPLTVEQQDKLRTRIVEKADGCLLWVTSLLTALEQPRTSRMDWLESIVDDFPAGLNDVYARQLKDIIGLQFDAKFQAAADILHILSGAARSLCEDELRHAVAARNPIQTLASLEKDSESQTGFWTYLQNQVGFLVRKEGNNIQLFHHSVKSFLFSLPTLDRDLKSDISDAEKKRFGCSEETVNALLARCCLTYLRLSDFSQDMSHDIASNLDIIRALPGFVDGESETSPAEQDDCQQAFARGRGFPFLDYASKFWAPHLSKCTGPEAQSLAQDAIAVSEKVNGEAPLWATFYREDGRDFPGNGEMSPLVVAAYFGHITTIAQVLDPEFYNKCITNEDLERACVWATRMGRYECVRTITDRAVHSRPPVRLENALFAAVERDHDIILRLLLAPEYNVDLASKNRDGNTPLWVAVANNSFACTETLLQRPDLPPWCLESLILAVSLLPNPFNIRRDGVKILEILIQDPRIDISSRSTRGETILARAAQVGDEHAITTLLSSTKHSQLKALLDDRGDEERRSHIWKAAWGGHDGIIKCLSTKMAIEPRLRECGPVGQTPVSVAARNGHASTVKLLIELAPTTADLKCDGGWSPLAWATMSDSAATAEALLTMGRVEVDSTPENNQSTPLVYAVRDNRFGTVRVLAAHGADLGKVITLNDDGSSVVHNQPDLGGNCEEMSQLLHNLVKKKMGMA